MSVTTGGGTAGEVGAETPALSPVAAPNPAADRTQICLTVDVAQSIRVAVYDAVGRQVAMLYHGPVAAGATASVTLDTLRLPAGVYLVRAAGETFVQTQRLAVAR